LALLPVGVHDGARAWKGFDWESMNRLHAKGFISDPRGKAKSIVFTEDGLQKAKGLLEKLFFDIDTTEARFPTEHVYAIVRFDHFTQSPESSVTVKEIVSTQAIAETEVKRLNELNSGKDCTYFFGKRRACFLRVSRRVTRETRRPNTTLQPSSRA